VLDSEGPGAHGRSVDELACRLETDAAVGLTALEARARLDAHGPNELARATRPPLRQDRAPPGHRPTRGTPRGLADSLALLVATVYVPSLQAPFGTVALTLEELAVVACLAIVPALVAEGAKVAVRGRVASIG
jgi:hypothetical protein